MRNIYSDEERYELIHSYDNYIKWLEDNGFMKDGKIIGNPLNLDEKGHYRHNRPYLIDKDGYLIDSPQKPEIDEEY